MIRLSETFSLYARMLWAAHRSVKPTARMSASTAFMAPTAAAEPKMCDGDVGGRTWPQFWKSPVLTLGIPRPRQNRTLKISSWYWNTRKHTKTHRNFWNILILNRPKSHWLRSAVMLSQHISYRNANSSTWPSNHSPSDVPCPGTQVLIEFLHICDGGDLESISDMCFVDKAPSWMYTIYDHIWPYIYIIIYSLFHW